MVARQFGKEFFDGDRLHGYGGYSYHPRFWQETIKRFRDHYQLAPDARLLSQREAHRLICRSHSPADYRDRNEQ